MTEQRKSVRELVRELLLERIGSGELGPGERVVEASLATELGVSAIPVREAIRELVAIGMLESAPNRGAWVRKVSLLETLEALRVRASLESLAAPAAVNRLKGRCAGLRQVVQDIIAAAQNRDFVAFQHHNQQFHRAIVAASDHGVLLRVWDSLAFEVRTRFVLEHLTSVDPLLLAKEHEAIAHAIERGDVKKTAALLRAHSRGLVRYLRQQVAAERKRRSRPSPPLPAAHFALAGKRRNAKRQNTHRS